ncbi:hypothetical protein AAAC51_06610 [Priestia megaterium]
MKHFSTEYFKNTLQYQSYIKAFNEIKQITGSTLEEIKLQDIDLEEVYFLCYVDEIIDSMIKAMEPDLVMDQEFANALRLAIDDIAQSFCIEIPNILHFGLLYYNSHLFDEVELHYWKRRMQGLFNGSCLNVESFKNFYENYFTDQLVGGSNPHITDFSDEMEYTYVFYIETDFADTSTYGPDYMCDFVSFAERYNTFYKDLFSTLKN